MEMVISEYLKQDLRHSVKLSSILQTVGNMPWVLIFHPLYLFLISLGNTVDIFFLGVHLGGSLVMVSQH